VHLTVIGLNHRTAPVEVREKLSVSEDGLSGALAALAELERVSECLILSTCNRTEVYACTAVRLDDESIVSWMCGLGGIALSDLAPHLYSHAGHKAIEHLFRVSTGIDSMVLGEAQILGQVKNAYDLARERGATGPVLNSLFQQAITVGKRARTETEIGRGAFSVGSVAAQIARSIFDELKGRTVLVIGAGEMAELALTHLTASGAGDVLVANRTFEHAEDLAARICGKALCFDDLASALAAADIVITSTGSREPIITRSMVASIMRARRGRPVFFIDIAVPRDIESGVALLDNVFVYDIDDLQKAVDMDAATRQAEVARVERIIAEEVASYMVRFRKFDAVPVITAMRDKFESIRAQEFDRLKARLRHLSLDDLAAIEAATRSIVNKICHQPMIQTKEYAVGEDSRAKLETICELFGICPVDGDESETRDAG
jgi:glutamyl-tRNA reductase